MRPRAIAKGLIARMGIRPIPIALTYEITWLCNLACRYCDRHTPMAREMKRDEIFSALDEFIEFGMEQIHLDGGDPLTHKHIDEVVTWLVHRDRIVSMNTNGILVPRKIETIRKLSRIEISLDGLKDNHDSMRGAGSFDKAIAGAKAAQAVGVPVQFTCTVGLHNHASIEAVVEIAED